MGLRGPKPSKEATTVFRVPVALAEALKARATAHNMSIPDYIWASLNPRDGSQAKSLAQLLREGRKLIRKNQRNG